MKIINQLTFTSPSIRIRLCLLRCVGGIVAMAMKGKARTHLEKIHTRTLSGWYIKWSGRVEMELIKDDSPGRLIKRNQLDIYGWIYSMHNR